MSQTSTEPAAAPQAIVRASDILNAPRPNAVSPTDLTGPSSAEYDVGNLCAFDGAPIDMALYKKDPARCCAEACREAAQGLVAELFSLPTQPSIDGPVAMLPKGTTKIPREKHVPVPKEKTRWEKFAERKGIMKKKRPQMVYDELTDKYLPRHGYKSVKKTHDAIEGWAIDHKEGMVDPFAEKTKEKKKAVNRQIGNQLRNVRRTQAKATKSLGAIDSLGPSKDLVARARDDRKQRRLDEKHSARGKRSRGASDDGDGLPESKRSSRVLRSVLGGGGKGDAEGGSGSGRASFAKQSKSRRKKDKAKSDSPRGVWKKRR
eukprot:m51a1_g2530 putative ribosome biogenesis regulatory protein (318) ;mRNA; f:240217-241487